MINIGSILNFWPLTIAECEPPSSLMVNVLKFKSLKLLSLSRVPTHEGVIESLTTSFPLLEEIYLGYCYGFTTFYGAPLKSFNDFLSNFPMIENLSLGLTSPCNNMKLSIHSLRTFELHSKRDLEEIDINTPNLLFFRYYGKLDPSIHTPFLLMKLSQPKGCMRLYADDESVDTLWFQKLRRFFDKSNIFKVLKLFVKQNTYETLLQQENKSRTNIRFVLSNFGKGEQHFNDLKLVLKALSLDERISRITFIKEEAPKQWHQKFDNTMLESGFKINECEKCVYVKDTSSGYVILCLYVDDMLIVGSNDKMIRSTKDMLKSKFDMKDMGLADVILGIKIIRTQNGLVLSQAHYVDKILNTHNVGDSGQARTPIDTSIHLSKNRGLGVAQLEYSRIIGMLMYLMTGTRPDLAYVVSRLSRYTSNPSYAHWKAITRVLHYLRYSCDYGLHYDRHPAVIEGYNDGNWISDIKDSRSTSGYVFTLGGAAISWKSSKQTVIAKSTMESEFIALDKCGEEVEWLRQFVEDIPRWPKPVSVLRL
ncbi:zinc finger, CCHC-type containing protein [Tanacetum coccineum]